MQRCVFCDEQILPKALVCKHCGATWDGTAWVLGDTRISRQPPMTSPAPNPPSAGSGPFGAELKKLVIVLIVIGGGIYVWAALSRTPTVPGVGGAPAGPVRVTYTVTGTARSADLTYQTASGSTQRQGVDVGVGSISTPMVHGDFVYLSAQNHGESGSVTCTITVDGIVVATNTASGGFAIATCSGSAP